ncbi:Hypothetical protein ETEE_3750 [Edwardsiella anguillarum ET080813]|uniref:Uncharacterized protein n=1 Tax=Edwardsiella anguillarum ET080813 TaxID=667120 RepID=A0A076LTZ0_9GAMM|nr:Hypothetical protein ETEE_3750 [Edwardsiella anguillarum ET080813]
MQNYEMLMATMPFCATAAAGILSGSVTGAWQAEETPL